MTLKEIVQQPETVFIDVRHPFELLFGSIKGAINIPLGQVEEQVDIFKHLPKPIVFYCRSGTRSGMAIDILKKHGVNKIYNGGSLKELRRLLKNPF